MSSSSDNKQLSGKVAVITGASGGIGAAIATSLASAGAKVVLGARRMDALEEVRTAVAAKCGSSDAVVVVQTDVTKREDVSSSCRLGRVLVSAVVVS